MVNTLSLLTTDFNIRRNSTEKMRNSEYISEYSNNDELYQTYLNSIFEQLHLADLLSSISPTFLSMDLFVLSKTWMSHRCKIKKWLRFGHTEYNNPEPFNNMGDKRDRLLAIVHRSQPLLLRYSR